MRIEPGYLNPNSIFKRQPHAAIAHLGLFCVTAWFVWRFGAIALGSLVIFGFLTYLAINKPFYILLLTIATIFFPANFEKALGQNFPITPTRLFGIMLLLAIITHFNRANWQYLKSNKTVVIAVVLLLWGAFTDLVSYPEYIATFLIDTIPSLIVLAAIVLFVEKRADLNKLLVVIMLACLVTAVSGFLQPNTGRAAGLSGNANSLAYNCMIGLTLTLAFIKKTLPLVKIILLLLLAVIFLAVFGMAASRSATIGLLAVAFVVMKNYIKKPSNLVIIFLLFVIFIYVAPEIFWQRLSYIPLPGHAAYSSIQSETGIRAWMYGRGWELFLESPVWGWGAFSYPKISGSFIPYVMHSWYLAMLCEQGIIGLALYLAFFITVYKNIKSGMKEGLNIDNVSKYLLALAIGLAVSGIFGTGPLGKLVFVMAGISVVLAKISASNDFKGTNVAVATKQ
jgi:O-antigen ligase